MIIKSSWTPVIWSFGHQGLILRRRSNWRMLEIESKTKECRMNNTLLQSRDVHIFDAREMMFLQKQPSPSKNLLWPLHADWIHCLCRPDHRGLRLCDVVQFQSLAARQRGRNVGGGNSRNSRGMKVHGIDSIWYWFHRYFDFADVFFSSILVQETPEAHTEEFALRLVDLIGPAAAHVRLPARESQGADGSWVGLWQRSTFFEKRRKFHRLGIFEDMLLPLSIIASVLVVFFSIGITCTFRKDRAFMSCVAVFYLAAVETSRWSFRSSTLFLMSALTENLWMTVEWKVSCSAWWHHEDHFDYISFTWIYRYDYFIMLYWGIWRISTMWTPSCHWAASWRMYENFSFPQPAQWWSHRLFLEERAWHGRLGFLHLCADATIQAISGP